MPDKTIYVGLFSMPTRNTADTSATFSLWPATGGQTNHWPKNSVITTMLDGGDAVVTPVEGDEGGTFNYANLAVGEHKWHASVTGDNIWAGDDMPGFDYTWNIVEP